ncbi:hypothetical protein PF003_g9158 [Phytophthora fragariae]|nr:hypothetical protein PF003_g9158 [Phytophthora fragariae]
MAYIGGFLTAKANISSMVCPNTSVCMRLCVYAVGARDENGGFVRERGKAVFPRAPRPTSLVQWPAATRQPHICDSAAKRPSTNLKFAPPHRTRGYTPHGVHRRVHHG